MLIVYPYMIFFVYSVSKTKQSFFREKASMYGSKMTNGMTCISLSVFCRVTLSCGKTNRVAEFDCVLIKGSISNPVSEGKQKRIEIKNGDQWTFIKKRQ
jgi:hypothetical protein